MHLIALHVHGSSNPIGITGNLDRIPMHSYFIFKDLVTVFVFIIVFSLFVFFSPNTLGQGWPLWYLFIISQCAICWKYIITFINVIIYNKTIYISGLFLNYIYNLYKYIKSYANPLIVKYYYKIYNQQITNSYYLNNYLVGISETTRTQKIIFKRNMSTINNNLTSSFKEEDIKFNQWLAGLIDGDGCFGITQKKYTNCEITVGIEDEKMLRLIQNKFGGSIKLRSGSNSIRYRLQNKDSMIKLVNSINGNIRNSKRLVQLYKICNLLNIEVINPIKLDINNSWISGYFDADGTINYYYSKNSSRPQLIISITNKYLIDIEPCKEILGGNIYFDKSQNGYFKWTISNEKYHMIFYNYIKNNPSRSYKGNRIFLIPLFYKNYNSKSYIKNDSLLYKNWLKFDNKWKTYRYKFK